MNRHVHSASRALFVWLCAMMCAGPMSGHNPDSLHGRKGVYAPLVGRTIAEEYRQADVVALGVVQNDIQRPQAKFVVKSAIKDHMARMGRTELSLEARVDERLTKRPVIVFAEVAKHGINILKGVPSDSEDDGKRLASYVREVASLIDADAAKRLEFHFQHLGTGVTVQETDSFRVFWKADFRDIARASARFDRGKLVTLLKAKEISKEHRGIVALLLGSLRDPADSSLLRAVLDSSEADKLIVNWEVATDGRPGLQGVMAGYCLANPAAGVDYLLTLLHDTEKPSGLQYCAAGALRFLFAEMPDAYVPAAFRWLRNAKEPSAPAVVVINVLRQIEHWDSFSEVRDLFMREKFRDPSVSVPIVEFAIKCPSLEAAQFVRDLRQNDRELVAEAERKLEDEANRFRREKR